MPDNETKPEEIDLESNSSSLEDNVIDATGGNGLESSSLENNTNQNSETNDQSKTSSTLNSQNKLKLKDKLAKFNIYLILFGLIVVLTIVVVVITYLQSQTPINNSTSLKNQNLTQNSLNQLAANDSTIGAPKQNLNVEANAVFAGRVLISNGLQVAGGEQINGGLGLTSLTVKGTGNFQQLNNSGNLSVTGNTSLQGSTTISASLQVNGNANFNGNVSSPQITTNSLQLSGNLNLSHHINVIGPSPSSTTLNAIGAGGTTTVNGTDTAGNININTGTNPSAGCLITVNFNLPYSSTPYIVVSPIGLASGSIHYYLERNQTSFNICSGSTPPSQANISFDYFIVG